jgi:alpha-D-ribose 1-methylphosphonate 5-triphosphate diphosphatase
MEPRVDRTQVLEMPSFCDLHVDIWDKMDGIISHSSWVTANKFLAYDQIIYSCGIGTAALCMLLQERPDGKSNHEEIDRRIDAIRDVKASAELLSQHVVHLRVEFLDSPAREAAFRLVEKHSDLIKIVSLVDHIPGYRQYQDAEQWYTNYQRRFGWSRGSLEMIAANRRDALLRRQAYISELSAELSKHPILLFSHDDQTDEEVTFAIQSGISCVEFPLNVAAANVARGNSVPLLVGTPNLLRGKSSFGNASAEDLIRDGGQIIFSGDYIPSSSFLALSKMSDAFSNEAIVQKFIGHAVLEPAALLSRVGIIHDTEPTRHVNIRGPIAQLNGVQHLRRCP